MNNEKCKFCGRDLYHKRENAKFCDSKCCSDYSRINKVPKVKTVKLNSINNVKSRNSTFPIQD